MADPALYDDIAGGLPPAAADLASLQYPWSATPADAAGPPTQEELAAQAMAAMAQPSSRPGESPRSPASPYQTQLDPQEESEFSGWVAANKVPFDPSPAADYDMRGFWKAMKAGDPRAATAINAGDGQLHFPDTWKTPYHATFSNESVYAGPDAPAWQGARLVDKTGHVIADETPPPTVISPTPFGPPPPTVAQLPGLTITPERQPTRAGEIAADPLRTQPGAQGAIGQLSPTQIATDEEAGRAIANLPPERQAEIRSKLEAAKADDFASKLLETATANKVKAQENADRYEKAFAIAQAKQAEIETDYKKLAAERIDPHGGLSGFQRVAGVLAAIVGGLVQGRTGAARNQGLDMLNAAIDRGIETQKTDLANRKGLLAQRQSAVGEMFARTGDLYRSQETARAAAYEVAIQQLQAEQLKYDPRGTTALRIADAITQARAQQQAGLRAVNQQNLKNALDISKENREGLLAQSTVGKNAAEITHSNAETAQIYAKLGGGGPGSAAPGTGYQVATGFYNPFMHPDEPGAAVMGKRQIGGKGEDAKERKGVQDQLDVYAGVNDYYGKLADIGRRIDNAKSLGETIWSARKSTLGAEYDNAREALMVYLTKQLGDKLTQGQLEAQQHRIPERASVFEARDPGKQIQDALTDADRDFSRSMSVVGIDADPVIKIGQRQRAVVQASPTQELDAAQAAAAARPEDKDARTALDAAEARVHDETAAAQKREHDIAAARDLPPAPHPLPELAGRPVAEAAAVKESNRATLRFTELLRKFHAQAGDTSYRKGLKPGELAAADAVAQTRLGSLAREVLDAQALAEQQRTRAAGEIRRHEVVDRATAAGIDPDEALRRAHLGLPIGDEPPAAATPAQPEPNPLAPNASYLPGADPFGPPVNASYAPYPPAAKPKKGRR